MARIKGTDVVALRKLLREKGETIEQAVMKKLSEQEQHAYQNIMATSWTPVETQAKLYEAAAGVLYPGSRNAVFQLHHELAKRSYSGIYKVFLTIPTIPFIIKRAANVWKTYYDAGVAEVENIDNKQLDFVVVDFPDLPQAMREATNAHINFLISATGKKYVNVARNDSNSRKWVWHVSWN